MCYPHRVSSADETSCSGGDILDTAATRTRQNRTITVDFPDEATYMRLLGDGKALVECVLAFLLALGCQFIHQATGRGGGCLTRHSHDVRVRLGGVSILASPVSHVQSRVHGPAACHLAVSLDATGGGP
jgi:hypothetical protein